MPTALLDGEQSRHMSIRLAADDHARLMACAEQQDRPVSRIIREALRVWFDAQQKTAA
jgi:predicted transcriptional regulator